MAEFKYAHGFNEEDSTELDNMLGSGNNFRETCVYIYNQNDGTAEQSFKQSFEEMPKEQKAQIKTIKSLNCTWHETHFTQDVEYFEISDQMPNEIYVLCEKPFEISERSQTPGRLWGKAEERSPTPEVKEEIRQPQAPQITEKQKENLRKNIKKFVESFEAVKELFKFVRDGKTAEEKMIRMFTGNFEEQSKSIDAILDSATPKQKETIRTPISYETFKNNVKELEEERDRCRRCKEKVSGKLDFREPFRHYNDNEISEIIGYNVGIYRKIINEEYGDYLGERAGKEIENIKFLIEQIESDAKPTRQETPPAHSAYEPKPITSFGRPYGTDPGQHSSFGTGGTPTKAGSGHSANPPAQPQKAQDASAFRARASSLSGKPTYKSSLQSRERANTIASSGPSKYEKKSSSKIRNFLDKILPKRKTSQSSSKIEFYNRTQNPNAQPFEEKQSDHKLVKNVDMICYKNYNEFRSLGFSKPDGFWKSKEINDYKCSEYYTDEKGTIGKQSPPKVCKIIISVNDISPRSALIFCDTPPTFRGDRFNKDDKKVWDEFKKLQKQAEKEAKKIQKPKKKSKL